MSTSAVVQPSPNLTEFQLAPAALPRKPAVRSKKRRVSVANVGHLPWREVALIDAPLTDKPFVGIKAPPLYVWLLTLTVVALHVGLGWYVSTHARSATLKPRPAEVALQFERAKPPEPKPPEQKKPEPPKPLPAPRATPQPLPPIQTAPPEPAVNNTASAAEPVAVAPVVTAPPEPAPPINATVSKAEYLNNPHGDYPAQAARQGWQGTVTVLVHIAIDGKVQSVQVKQSSGRKVLDDDALNTIKHWAFTPRKRGDTPVEADVTVPYEYVLE